MGILVDDPLFPRAAFLAFLVAFSTFVSSISGASAVEALLEKALESGGDDNISIIVVEVK